MLFRSQNSSLVFFKTFPFGTNLIFSDIKQLCSITKNEIEDIIENLSDNKTGFIDRKFFKNSDFKKLSVNHFKDIINARAKEILDYTFNNNKGLNYYYSRIGRINLFFEDKNIHKNLKDLFKDHFYTPEYVNTHKIDLVLTEMVNDYLMYCEKKN